MRAFPVAAAHVRDYPVTAVHACVCRDGEQAWRVTFQSHLCMLLSGVPVIPAVRFLCEVFSKQ